MNEREKLANYQAELLNALHAAETVEQAETALRELATEAGLAEDLGSIDPNMLRVAMQLTKKWAVRTDREK